MFSTRTPESANVSGAPDGACPAGTRRSSPMAYGSSMSLMLSVTALTAVAKIGPSSDPLAAQK